jgi:opacity protein-like surface antigen
MILNFRLWNSYVARTVLCSVLSVLLLSVGVAGAQSRDVEGLSSDRPTTSDVERARQGNPPDRNMNSDPANPSLSTSEAERAREAERANQAQRARAVGTTPPDRASYHYERPGEVYVGGFGGYTFGHNFNNLDGSLAAGSTSPGIDLKNSGIYGAKMGYFFPDHLNWLGVEVEGFNTSPHLKQSAIGPGEHLRVTTAAVNLIARGKFACGPRGDSGVSRRTTTESGTDRYGRDYRADTFCPLQPYVGVGLGVFFAHASGGLGSRSDSDNAVPGLNALAGIRYFLTEHVAVFGEYKYNRASFNFDDLGPGATLKGDYSVSHVVGGLSFHF